VVNGAGRVQPPAGGAASHGGRSRPRRAHRPHPRCRGSQAGQFLAWPLIAWGRAAPPGQLDHHGALGWFLPRRAGVGAPGRLADVTVGDVTWFGIARAAGTTDAAMLWDRMVMSGWWRWWSGRAW
jgi:hypothetical protein